ncbi:MAG TPA: hypothetical protein VG675_12325 [Bryobacteraceae bacterium]|nr:hypothetical protein [Bryobacteraceae bacterium]
METWATFSIIDHRAPVYRQALALFDRIVVPVPPEPIGDQTREELTQLEAEISYLADHHAAELHEWNSDVFTEWRVPVLAEAIADGFNRDAYTDTRLMLAETFTSGGVQAVPVYNGNEHYLRSRKEMYQAEEALTVEILQRLPVPDYDTPLENLVRLRETAAFRTALDDLLEWKRLQLPAIVLAENRPQAIAAAMKDFDKHTRTYAEAMESEGYKKAGSVASIFFALFTGEVLGAMKEGLVSFREVREPCWKKVSAMKCAPGGVVYHFKQAVH